jgi:DNA ligase (NAD+)
MVIPKIDDNLTRSNTLVIPDKCPCCGAEVIVKDTDNSQVLMCPNPNCSAKKIAQFTHFVSRKCMNIDGLSEKTLETLLSHGFIRIFKDIYHLSDHRQQLIHLDGFGKKSVEKLLKSIEDSRNVKLENFVAALGIPNIGLTAAKTVSKACNGNWNKLWDMWNHEYDFTQLEDFGEVTASSLVDFFDEYINDIDTLAAEMNFILPEEYSISDNPFNGKTICVTGKLNSFTRDTINEKIISLGAKVAGSVSKKTDYLITNESSGSSKYKKAIDLNIPIITEDEFLGMI